MKRFVATVAFGTTLVLFGGGVADAQYGGGETPTTPVENTTTTVGIRGTTTTTAPGGTTTTAPGATTSTTTGGSTTTSPGGETTTSVSVLGITIDKGTPSGGGNPGGAVIAQQPGSQVLGVTTTRGSLARTGQEALPAAAAGAALVAVGAVFIAAARRRNGAEAV